MSAVDRGGVIALGQEGPGEIQGTTSETSALGGYAKRAFDVVGASAILLMLSPLFLFTSIAVALSTRGPILFGHERIGLGGRRFRCWKFRTMCADADTVLRQHLMNDPDAREEWSARRKLKSDPRITQLGRVLREYSVDELPQLFNVIRGDMSLVGPRPVVEDELHFYGSKLSQYCAARPGITGLWQVSGRSDTDYDQRVELDARYVMTWSFLSDMLIMLRTIPAVVGARGSY